MENICLEKIGQLHGRVRTDDLSGGLAGEVLEGSRHMRLISVTHLVGRVTDGDALFQKGGGLLSTLNQLDGFGCEAGGAQETAADRALREVWALVLEDGADERVKAEEVLADQPMNEGFDVLEVGQVPGGAVQPEGSAGGVGEQGVGVEQAGEGKEGQEGAEFEANDEALGPFGVGFVERPCEGPLDSDAHLAVLAHEKQVPVGVGGTGGGVVLADLDAPDHVYVGRVGWSALEDCAHMLLLVEDGDIRQFCLEGQIVEEFDER